MAAQRKRAPTASEIQDLLDKGWSREQIAVKLDITTQYVYNIMSQEKKRVPEKNPAAWRWAPWWVRREHMNSQAGRRLKFINDMRNGNTPRTQFIVDDINAWVANMEYNDFVISYHHDTPPNRFESKGGFFIRPRRPGDSPGLMQVPDENEKPPPLDLINEWFSLFD